MSEKAPSLDVQPSASNHFAWLRTDMALQRTLMAAVRTGVSLISFGFTVAQFFQKGRDSGAPITSFNGPRLFGLVLIATAVVSVATFTWQYHSMTRHLQAPPFDTIAGVPQRTSSYLIAWVVLVIGVAAFVSVLVRF